MNKMVNNFKNSCKSRKKEENISIFQCIVADREVSIERTIIHKQV